MATQVAGSRLLPQVIDQPVLQLTLLQLSTILRQSMVLRPRVVPLQVLQLPILLEHSNPSIVRRTRYTTRIGTGTPLAGTRHRRYFRNARKVFLQFVRTLDRSL